MREYRLAFIQVAWLGQQEQMTWEPASTLPQSLIDEFEGGVIGVGETITNTQFGAINHTLVVATSCDTASSPAKKLKTVPVPSDSGYTHACTYNIMHVL